MTDNTIYLLCNTRSKNVHLQHKSRTVLDEGDWNHPSDYVEMDEFTLTYSPEDERKFTDIKVVSRTKLKNIPSSADGWQQYGKPTIEGVIIKRAASEDFFLLRRCPIIKPLLSENEIKRLQEMQGKCRRKQQRYYKSGNIINENRERETISDDQDVDVMALAVGQEDRLSVVNEGELRTKEDEKGILRGLAGQSNKHEEYRRAGVLLHDKLATNRNRELYNKTQERKIERIFPKTSEINLKIQKTASGTVKTKDDPDSKKNGSKKTLKDNYSLNLQNKVIKKELLPLTSKNRKKYPESVLKRGVTAEKKALEKDDLKSPVEEKKKELTSGSSKFTDKSEQKTSKAKWPTEKNKIEKSVSDTKLLEVTIKSKKKLSPKGVSESSLTFAEKMHQEKLSAPKIKSANKFERKANLEGNDASEGNKTPEKGTNKLESSISTPNLSTKNIKRMRNENKTQEDKLSAPTVKSQKKNANKFDHKGNVEKKNVLADSRTPEKKQIAEGTNRLEDGISAPDLSTKSIKNMRNEEKRLQEKLSNPTVKSQKKFANKFEQKGNVDENNVSVDSRTPKKRPITEGTTSSPDLLDKNLKQLRNSTSKSDKTTEDEEFNSSYVLKKNSKASSSKRQTHKNEGDRGEIDKASLSKFKKAESEERLKFQQHLAEQNITSMQGQSKDRVKSLKAAITEQWASSNKELVVQTSQLSFDVGEKKLAKKGSVFRNRLTSILHYVIQYILSDPVFVKLGWTLQAIDKSLSRLVTFKTFPANHQAYCFRIRKEGERKHYLSGKLAVNMREDGTCEVYYPNGLVAIESQMSSQGMRLILYSDPTQGVVRQKNDRARVLGVFDSLGNGVVYNWEGEKILMFNQLQGIFKTPKRTEPYKWKWSVYNVLQNQITKEILRLMVQGEKAPEKVIESVKQTTLTSDTGNKDKLEKNGELDPTYSNALAELPYPVPSPSLTWKKHKFSNFRTILLKINKEMSLEINEQDKVFIKFSAEKVFHTLHLGIVVDPKRVERVDEVVPEKLSEVPCVFDDLLHLPPSLEKLNQHLRFPKSVK